MAAMTPSPVIVAGSRLTRAFSRTPSLRVCLGGGTWAIHCTPSSWARPWICPWPMRTTNLLPPGALPRTVPPWASSVACAEPESTSLKKVATRLTVPSGWLAWSWNKPARTKGDTRSLAWSWPNQRTCWPRRLLSRSTSLGIEASQALLGMKARSLTPWLSRNAR